MRTVPGAASSALIEVLTGPSCQVEVVAALPQAVYLRVAGCSAWAPGEAWGGACGGVPPAVCLVTPRAVRVPPAVVVDGLGYLPPGGLGGLPVGARGIAGDGRIDLPGLVVRVARWWRVPQPSIVRPVWITRGNRSLAADPDTDFPECSEVDGLAEALVGRGPGLTPLGDDILAGMLVTLRAIGAPSASLAATVLRRADRTTFVSSTLLWHAARGECVPELAALLRAVGAGRGVAAARARVLSLGHTSGAGLLHGVDLILGAGVAAGRDCA